MAQFSQQTNETVLVQQLELFIVSQTIDYFATVFLRQLQSIQNNAFCI